MTRSAGLGIAGLIAFGCWLAACALESGQANAPEVREQRQILNAIRRYYESNAAERNNACSALIMSSISRIELVSRGDGQLVVDVTYFYDNYAHRDSNLCRGFGSRQFTLTRTPNGFRVVAMTGERRLGARWRLW